MAEPQEAPTMSGGGGGGEPGSSQLQAQSGDIVELGQLDGAPGPSAAPLTPAKDDGILAATNPEAGASATHMGPAEPLSLSMDWPDHTTEEPAESSAQAAAAAHAAPGDGGPVCNITLLLPTGARHPYRIDEKYLAKRNVEVPDLTEPGGRRDPFSISVYKLKELILREWRDEWDGKPASPSSIRLIYFGKLLEDKEQLKKYNFSGEDANVVHMSVRPAEMMEEDEGAKGKSSGRDGRNRDGGGGCCVIL